MREHNAKLEQAAKARKRALRGQLKREHLIAFAIFVAFGFFLFFALLIMTAPPAIAPTQPSTPLPLSLDDETLRVAKNLYCPVCPGVPLDVCETQACVQWRGLIREKLSQGQTSEQIEEYFVAQYGERVLGAPRPAGLNLLVYAAPLLAVVSGGGILYLVLRQRLATRAAPVPSSTPEELRERIERELAEKE